MKYGLQKSRSKPVVSLCERAQQGAVLFPMTEDGAAGVAAPWGYFFVMLNYFIREAFGVTHFWVFGN